MQLDHASKRKPSRLRRGEARQSRPTAPQGGADAPDHRAGSLPLFTDAVLPVFRVAGVDEAGRGPLAGPVFAAAVILDDHAIIEGLNDSKKLTAGRREELAIQIRERSLAWYIASASVAEIDQFNILGATMLAMRRACDGLQLVPQQVLVDGNQVPRGLRCTAQYVIGGDAKVAAISAASILAKTARDAYCGEMHLRFPDYGFDRHKGYATALHLERLLLLGPCEEHRRSFAPVRRHFETAV